MADNDQTKEQLLEEIQSLRLRLLQLETDRRQAEETLRESETKWRQLAQTCPDIIYSLDRHGAILFLNHAYPGYPPLEEVIGTSVYDWIPPEQHALFRQSLEAVFETGEPVSFEASSIRPDGATTWWRNHLGPVKLNGRVRAVTAVAIDITGRRQLEESERQRAEAALWASEVRSRAMLDSSMDASISIDQQGRVLEWNPAAEQMFGYSRAQVLGKEMAQLIIPANLQDAHRRGLAHYLATGQGPVFGKRLEMSALRADGSEFPVELAIRPISIEGAPLFTGFVRDISERKRAQESLRVSEELMRQAVQVAGFGIFDHDQRSDTIYWTPQMRTICGWGPAEPVTLSAFVDRIHPEDRAAIAAAIRRAHDPAGDGLYAVEHRLVRRDGSRRWVLTRSQTFFEGEGNARRPVRTVGALMDITERKQAEEALRRFTLELEERVRQRTAQLEAANKDLEAFSYSVSHDLRAPLRAINGFCDILLRAFRPQLPPDAAHYLDRVVNSGRQMGQLIDDLLAFSRLGRHPLKKQRVEPARIVHQVLAELQPERQGRRVEVQLGELPACQADPALLRQVYVNLLGNALKYTRMRDPALIEIGCRTDADTTEQVYFVKDNGVGFDMRYAGKLFGVFQRLHRADEFPGTGVGLAIVQRILQRHGGCAWALAEVNRGATFYFTLGSETAHE